MSINNEQSVLPKNDQKYLRFFCMSCGALLVSENAKKCASCKSPICNSTESLLVEEFEAASDDVKIKILESIDSGRFKLGFGIIATFIPRIVSEVDEKFLGFFCMSCGEMFSGESMKKKKCAVCGAVITRATQEAICNEFRVAKKATQEKISSGITFRTSELVLYTWFFTSRLNM